MAKSAAVTSGAHAGAIAAASEGPAVDANARIKDLAETAAVAQTAGAAAGVVAAPVNAAVHSETQIDRLALRSGVPDIAEAATEAARAMRSTRGAKA